MMKSLLWILALFALAVGVSLAMRTNEGYVLLVLPPYRAWISFNFAVFFTPFAFAALYALLRAVALASSLPHRVRESLARRKGEKAAETFRKGLRLYLAGKPRKAIDAMIDLRKSEGDWADLAASLAARIASELDAADAQGKRPAELAPPVEAEPLAETEADEIATQEPESPVSPEIANKHNESQEKP
jgi:HemY protein